MNPPKREGGYAPIESYAALSDCKTVALVATDGCIDWLPVPMMDSPPVFAGIVDDHEGGLFVLTPTEPFTVERRYLDRTNVLETTFTTDSGIVRVVDALILGRLGPLPWTELVREVTGVSGSVELTWTVRPGTRFETARPWTETKHGHALLHVGDQHIAVILSEGIDSTVGNHDVGGTVTVAEGESHVLGITSCDSAPLVLPTADDLRDRLRVTISRWKQWSETVDYEGPFADAVMRSALALKCMEYAPTGAIAAAPTTSLPERIGGDKNWDYRFMWVRDTSFTADALISLNLQEEVQAILQWLLGTVRKTAPHLHVFYTLDGDVPGGQRQLRAEGYRGSQPVRSGNGASEQIQLGTFGDLFDTVWRFVDDGHTLDPLTAETLTELADRCCDIWMLEDSGIWELGELQHYTISKIGCWTALDRALLLADRCEISGGHAHRWRQERDEIKRWVDAECWSPEKSSYTFFAGTDRLDAATLLAGRTRFETGERLSTTIDAVRRELGHGPLLYRYSGMQVEEGCFLACTFWAVTALYACGRVDEARSLMEEAVGLTNDVGLMAEMADPTTGGMLGNFPQGLSHLALVNAAVTLAGR